MINYINTCNDDLKVIDFSVNDMRDECCNERVIVIGQSSNAKEGAILKGDYGLVHVTGLDEWPDILSKKKVTVRVSTSLIARQIKNRVKGFRGPSQTL